MRAGQLWRGRRIAPAHEGPRNESNNKAHEPTSGRSTHYGSGHLIRVFRDIGHIFSSLYPLLAVLFLSRCLGPRDLLLCAKHLFVAATRQLSEPRAQGRAMAALQPSPAVESTIPPGHRARLHGGKNATPAREFCCVSISVLFSLIAPMVIFRWL